VNAERCAAITCLNYLRFSFNLVDQSIADEHHTQSVSKGLYSLQAYVYEHWLDHILTLASEIRGLADQQLEACLDDLFEVLSKHGAAGGTDVHQTKTELYQATILIERRLKHAEHYGPMYDILCHCVKHRHEFKVNFGQNGNDSE
jgi:hypothetical protein